VRRRRFIATALAAVALPSLAVRAAKTHRIGWVTASPQDFSQPLFAAFREGLRDQGYVEGDNLTIEIRDSNGTIDRLPAAVRELTAGGVDLIMCVAGATRPTVANAGAVPVVFVFSADPVEAGVTQSLARPSGNATGITLMSVELNGKRLELLRQIRPDLKRTAIIASPDHAGERLERENSEQVARVLGLDIDYFPVHNKAELEAGLAALGGGRSEAIVAFPDPVTVGNRARIIEAATEKRIPVISGWALFARSGALCTYGPKLSESYRRAAYYVDRILKGAKPGDLPIERPTNFELVINLKTADALGIAVPQTVLARADEVLE
jgi:putative tryptophan/tyrosine transport system substrate-binding protein